MQLSFTKLDTFSRCRRRYRYRYIEKRQGTPFKPSVYGRTLHQSLQRYHEFARKDGIVHEADVLQAFDHFMTKDQKDVSVRDTPAYAEGVALLQRYCERENKLARVPAYLEKEISIEYGPYSLTGIIDRIDFAANGHYAIIDYKMDRKLPKVNASQDNRQLQFYALLAHRGLGMPISEVSVYFLRHGIEHRIAWQPAFFDEFTGWLDSTFAAMEQAMKKRDWEPTESEACRTCPYTAACPLKTKRDEPLRDVWQQPSLLGDE